MKLAGNDAEAVERSRDMMERQLEQMVRLVDDLMEVSRITRGNVELKRQRVFVATIVSNAVEASRFGPHHCNVNGFENGRMQLYCI